MRRLRQSGQALVEFALVFPLFAALVFGIIDVGRLVYINNALSEGTREGARWGSVQGRARDEAGRSSVESYVMGAMAGVPTPAVVVSCESVTGVALTACGTDAILVVTATTSVAMLTPVGAILGSPTLSSTSRVVVNQ